MDLSGAGFGFGGGGFLAVSSLVTRSTTVKAEIVVETALTFFCMKLTILSKFIRNRGRGGCGGGRLCRLLVVIVVTGRAAQLVFGRVVVFVVRVVSGVVGFLRGLVVGFRSGSLVVRAGAGFFAESFPVAGIDGMG